MDLQELRSEIDRVDASLVSPFVQRMELSSQVAVFKKAHALPVLDTGREQEKLLSVSSQVPAYLQTDIRALYELILARSRDRQTAVMRDEVDK